MQQIKDNIITNGSPFFLKKKNQLNDTMLKDYLGTNHKIRSYM